MKNAVFWDVAPCRYCVKRRFGGTSFYTIYTRRHIPDDGILLGKLTSAFHYRQLKRNTMHEYMLKTYLYYYTKQNMLNILRHGRYL
jgi:hypothetical protein